MMKFDGLLLVGCGMLYLNNIVSLLQVYDMSVVDFLVGAKSKF